jgi:hypothetical protein
MLKPQIRAHGGLSWDDNPTENYQAISILSKLGVLDAVGFNKE